MIAIYNDTNTRWYVTLEKLKPEKKRRKSIPSKEDTGLVKGEIYKDLPNGKRMSIKINNLRRCDINRSKNNLKRSKSYPEIISTADVTTILSSRTYDRVIQLSTDNKYQSDLLLLSLDGATIKGGVKAEYNNAQLITVEQNANEFSTVVAFTSADAFVKFYYKDSETGLPVCKMFSVGKNNKYQKIIRYEEPTVEQVQGYTVKSAYIPMKPTVYSFVRKDDLSLFKGAPRLKEVLTYSNKEELMQQVKTLKEKGFSVGTILLPFNISERDKIEEYMEDTDLLRSELKVVLTYHTDGRVGNISKRGE